MEAFSAFKAEAVDASAVAATDASAAAVDTDDDLDSLLLPAAFASSFL